MGSNPTVGSMDIDQIRLRWAADEPRWHFVLETFWQLDYQQMLAKLSQFPSLDEAMAAAERERDGMVAT